MPQGQRPQSLKLRQAPRLQSPKGWFTNLDNIDKPKQYYRYGQDVGNFHVIDYWLDGATKGWFAHNPRKLAQRIGRYLDGEEEREGTYR